MSGRLYCLASTESKRCWSSATSASAISVTLLSDKFVLCREALRLRQRLIVDHDELALVRPAVPLQEDLALWLPSKPQLRPAVGGRAVVGDLQLAPNEDLRLGFASNDFAGMKWKNLTGTARWSDGTEMVTLDYSHLTML